MLQRFFSVVLVLALLIGCALAQPSTREAPFEEILQSLLAEPDGFEPIITAEADSKPRSGVVNTTRTSMGWGLNDRRWLSCDSPAVIEDSEEAWRLVQEHPDLPSQLLPSLPKRPEVIEWAKHRQEENSRKNSLPSWRLKEWLQWNSDYQRDQLIAEAAKPYSYQELCNLAILDWPAALPLIERLEAGEDQQLKVFALAARLRHDPADAQTRNRLIQLSLPGDIVVRRVATEALLWIEWPGKEKWYLDRLADWPVVEMPEPHLGPPLLDLVLRADKERWLPVLIGALNGPGREAAAACLVEYREPRARLALLPWLEDPNWVTGSRRLWYIEGLSPERVPEAVPGLLSVLRNGQDLERVAAAELLQQAPPAEFTEALREAIDEVVTAYARYGISRVALQLGLFSDAELLQSLESLARFANERELSLMPDLSERPFGIGWVSREAVLGKLTWEGRGRQAIAAAVVSQVHRFKQQQPGLAQKFEEILLSWQDPVSLGFLVERVFEQPLDLEMTRLALARGPQLKAGQSERLKTEIQRGGYRAGLAASILNDPPFTAKVLSSGDEPAVRTLLACARHHGLSLPVDLVMSALSDSTREAVVAYLTAFDTKESHEALAALGERPVWGSLESFSGRSRHSELVPGLEKELQAELLREGAPEEIYVYLEDLYHNFNLRSRSVVVRVWPDRSECVWTFDGYRWYRSELGPDDLESLLYFMSENRVEQWTGHHGSSTSLYREYLFYHLKSDSGHRLYAKAPSGKYAQLSEELLRLTETQGEPYYPVVDVVPGARIESRSFSRSGIPHFKAAVEKTGADSRQPIEVALERLQQSDEDRIRPEFYPVGPAEGEWGLVSYRPHLGAKSNLMLLHLGTLTLKKIDLDPGQSFIHLDYIPAQNAFLVYRSDGKAGGTYLVDLGTGKSRRATGELRPWHQAGDWVPQYAEKYKRWASIQENNGVSVGLLDERSLEFERVVFYPKVGFGSDEFWVADGRVYAVMNSDSIEACDLLSLPLRW